MKLRNVDHDHIEALERILGTIDGGYGQGFNCHKHEGWWPDDGFCHLFQRRTI